VAPAIEITGCFLREKFSFDNGDSSRVIIGVLDDQAVIKGPAEPGGLEAGLTYRFYGQWTEHHKYGRQFAFRSFTLATPVGERGTIRYLAHAAGIGPRRAREIWERFGEDSLVSLRESPDVVAEQIAGLSLAAAQKASEFFKAQEGAENLHVELAGLIEKRGFPRETLRRVIAKWGNGAPEIIRENPYALLAFPGVGFLSADKLYLEVGKNPAAIERQSLCVWYAIHSDQQGHVWYSEAFLQQALNRQVSGVDNDLTGAVDTAIADGKLVMKSMITPDGARLESVKYYFAEKTLADIEEDVAGMVSDAREELSSAWFTDLDVSLHQRNAVEDGLAEGCIGLLTGGPGTGKTYTLAALIKAIDNPSQIAVCAPTGKAAVRCTSALARQGVAMTATTIHTLLGVESKTDEGWAFTHDESCPLPYKYIFVDESSMVDLRLLWHLLKARQEGAFILFVGDPNQLPPVGDGAPLRDMIAAGVPCGKLTEIHRNAGAIVHTCVKIRDKRTIGVVPVRFDLPQGNLVLTRRATMSGQVKALRDTLYAIERIGKYDPVLDCQILVAVNEKSKLSRKTLNETLQEYLNKDGHRVDKNEFRIGDKVICLRNSFYPSAMGRGQQEYVANGDIGIVIRITPTLSKIQLHDPTRTVIIPGNVDWSLAYAITAHKSQGSEWPVVIVMLDSYPAAQMVCEREWLYTAISRAQDCCVMIGTRATADGFCQRSGIRRRRTFLKELLE
jgi:exodeoxyribonuclease V alpha subunit